VFDGSILAGVAVSAPEMMVKLVSPTIDSFADIAENERKVLFETFRVWVDSAGSMRTAGEALFCHPNTVRYRLHRIEQCTGRSLTRPRDVAELCLASEVHHRLMRPAANLPLEGDPCINGAEGGAARSRSVLSVRGG
jgi:DNA-binding PucR family transcriptional regulator